MRTSPEARLACGNGPDSAFRAESWAWLPGLHDEVPRLTSAFGDVFLQGEDGFWFLDTVEGTLTRRWTDGAALQSDINDRETQEQLLMPGLVAAAEALGIVPTDSEILTFKVPPVLGGSISVDNLEAADFIVTLDFAGQLHRQIKDLPPGTSITDITVEKH